MQTTGFIKLPRALMLEPWYQNVNARLVFLQLLLTANFTDGEKLKRGQVATSAALLAKDTALTERQVRIALTALVKAGVVSRVASRLSSSLGTIITICDFDRYQGHAEEPGHHAGHQTRHQPEEERKCTKKEEESKELFEEEERGNLAPTPPTTKVTLSTESTPPKKRQRQPFVPPTEDEVAQYVAEHNLLVDPHAFFQYYTLHDWRIQDHRRIKNWKLKVQDWHIHETSRNAPASSLNAPASSINAPASSINAPASSINAPASSINTQEQSKINIPYEQSHPSFGIPRSVRPLTKAEANLYALQSLLD